MRCKLFTRLFFVALVATCCAVALVPARAQEQQPQQPPQQQQPPPPQEEEILTRGAFLTTRPKTANKENKQAGGEAAGSLTLTPPKTSEPPVIANNAPAAKNNNAKSSNKKKNAGRSAKANSRNESAKGDATPPGGVVAPPVYKEAALKPRPIGLGYTLFSLGDNGEAVRTDPARQFRTGEAIRISLESNTDGYLYIFHTENDGEPSMIYPDARLNGGNNFVGAHIPYEIPSSQAASEEMRWFVFKDPPADERLYVILTRQPLAGVPTGAALADYCFSTENVCPWHPVAAVWTELKAAQEREQVAVSRVKDEGRAQTSDERDATTRGLGLANGAPQPSIIRMTASANSTMLVTAIDLIHK